MTMLYPLILLINLMTIAKTSIDRNNKNDISEIYDKTKSERYEDLGDHTMVTDSVTFPYVVAVLKKTTYMSAGALIDQSWVLTAADALFLEFARILRVRLGSVNHKKGGVLMPVKFFQIHPRFDDNNPQYDIALIKLPTPVRLTPNMNPIALQSKPHKVASTHFIITGWQPHLKTLKSAEHHHHESVEVVKRHRMLSVSHLHPTEPDECIEQLRLSGLNQTKTLMCLDPAVGTNPCERQTGAPVVLNGVLWGIISSWKAEDCEVEPGPTFVTLVAAEGISSWIHATKHARKWNDTRNNYYEENVV